MDVRILMQRSNRGQAAAGIQLLSIFGTSIFGFMLAGGILLFIISKLKFGKTT
jgi:hypothetical protein